MELALGTAQFGLTYGVAGRGQPVPEAEVRLILRRAHALGLRWLDTAVAYGDIEQRLSELSEGADFAVVTKVPAAPPDLAPHDAAGWLRPLIERSSRRLGPALRAVLFHQAADLLGPCGDVLWQVASELAMPHGWQIGVSCYDSDTLDLVSARFPVALAQLPGNALDQRLARPVHHAHPAPAIHLRSAFLQGLLLLPEHQAQARVPAARAALARWHAWCRDRNLTPLQAALGVVKGLPRVTHCVVGVDSIEQLEAIAAAWARQPLLQAPELATGDADVIDPRRWASAIPASTS